ncbi:MAG TPA: hypothetical protein VK581_01070 [Chthoniobacterales bacterium]|nr:hypothetical protein [Chthoniobacterales bacterium]
MAFHAFYYHSLLNCELFFYVKPDVLGPYLADTGFNLVLEGARCGAVRTFQSAPVATQARAFFVNP